MYAIVDIETTGGHASAHGITEIAILIYDGQHIVNRYQTLINPLQQIPGYITALTGISNAMVASAPEFEQVAEEIHSLLHDKIFVAHNVNFDFSFVKHHLGKAGFELNVKKLCTVRLSRKVLPGMPSYSLGNICRQVGITIEARHRAGGDAEATVILFQKLGQQGAEEHIQAMLKKSSAEQWLPIHLDKKEITSLPSLPGVYYFHDAKGKIIYVGKAVNIKKRVSSHFTHNEAGQKRQHFLRLITKITHKICASELHALVLESTEIKRLWPKYNYSQKQPAQRFALYSFTDCKGYTRLAIDKKKKNLPALYQFNLLHEGIVMLKKMVEEFGLNQKLCFLDKTVLSEQDLKDAGSPVTYNHKVQSAIKALEEKLPSFAIIDKGISENEKLCMLIERGIFWGMGYINSNEEIDNISFLKEKIERLSDNDFIRNSMYAYAEQYPAKKMMFKVTQSLQS
ncbi:MAG: exonuclease domain-containing protein [Ferruginibacter sp.]